MASLVPHAPSAVSARIDLRYGLLYRTWLPLVIVRLPTPPIDTWPVLDPTLQRLRDTGWAHPDAVMRGAHINAVARATVDGALLDGPVSIAGGGLMLYQGILHRCPAWIDAVRAAGTVSVIATTLDDDRSPTARDGEVLGAHGVLFHRGITVTGPTVPTSCGGN